MLVPSLRRYLPARQGRSLLAPLVFSVLLSCANATRPEFVPTSVTFLGGSITLDMGDLEPLFGPDAATWINAGAGGNTAAQLLDRVGTAVDPTTSHTAVVLIGINDLWDGAGNGMREDIVPPGTAANGYHSVGGYIMQIADSLEAMGVRPVLATLLPVTATYAAQDPAHLNEGVRTLNAWLRDYARSHQLALIDYYPAFVGTDGYGRPELYAEGLHPNEAGYTQMAATAGVVLRQLGLLR